MEKARKLVYSGFTLYELQNPPRKFIDYLIRPEVHMFYYGTVGHSQSVTTIESNFRRRKNILILSVRLLKRSTKYQKRVVKLSRGDSVS